ncbi:hypothetical protein GUITHDRAFT_142454 [Guillardia theta CCMP2712]|uniref:Uncharacterized protein n=1 Tax=Guillardia theta (strain CCMP2712) TaxID=905079 RepID=L1IYD9_GUITC|nr:hypothetical protein GUITHDRAFT_142454 [Guillardia theta CCMP2712]EKX40830.1 hypothetical protein GUITHDRAFT_142454 [Guillardia theta CCMP2712]|eukprot:XP_005827810.1 hypothetical protein GUITHDRAFT_142454 [Guillardia theta CCMP2712]
MEQEGRARLQLFFPHPVLKVWQVFALEKPAVHVRACEKNKLHEVINKLEFEHSSSVFLTGAADASTAIAGSWKLLPGSHGRFKDVVTQQEVAKRSFVFLVEGGRWKWKRCELSMRRRKDDENLPAAGQKLGRAGKKSAYCTVMSVMGNADTSLVQCDISALVEEEGEKTPTSGDQRADQQEEDEGNGQALHEEGGGQEGNRMLGAFPIVGVRLAETSTCSIKQCDLNGFLRACCLHDSSCISATYCAFKQNKECFHFEASYLLHGRYWCPPPETLEASVAQTVSSNLGSFISSRIFPLLATCLPPPILDNFYGEEQMARPPGLVLTFRHNYVWCPTWSRGV